MSKEKLKKEFTKTLKNVYSLRESLEKKKDKMIDLSSDLFYKETKLTRENALCYNNINNIARNLTELTIRNSVLHNRENELITDTFNASLTSKLLVKNLQEDSTAPNWKKNAYNKKFDKLNKDILFNITILDTEYFKLENLYNRLKANKISINSQ